MGKNPQQKEITRQFSSGGAVYRKFQIPNPPAGRAGDKCQIKWLIARSTPSDLFPKSFWRLPKGWIDNASHDIPGPMASGAVKADEESLQTAALREVSEEGGVAAKIVSKIGTSTYFLNLPEGRVMKFVTFYLMEWLSDLSEGTDEETSEVRWLEFDEARKLLSFSHEKQILDKTAKLLV